jgi:hypothetical protein
MIYSLAVTETGSRRLCKERKAKQDYFCGDFSFIQEYLGFYVTPSNYGLMRERVEKNCWISLA